MKVKRSSEFRGRNWCAKAREYDGLSLTKAKNNQYDNAIIAKEIIIGYLKGKYKLSQIRDLVSQGIESDYVLEKEGEARQERLVKIITRACRSERRTPSFPSAKELEFDDYIVQVAPDVVFDNGDSLDLVIYRAGKPNVTMNGTKRDHSVKQCLELYFLLEYGKSLLTDGEVKTVRANYYFLRKNTDSDNKAQFDTDFFSSTGDNIVYLEQTCVGGSTSLTELDKNFRDLLEQYAAGDECTEEDCKRCIWNPSCHYVATPEHLIQKTHTAKGKIVPSEAQRQVISFRKGICRVNAAAGSGKTECVTERVAQMIQEGVKPSEILCITFTDAGAREMKERISLKCAGRGIHISGDDIYAMTFNSFAYQIVRDQYQVCGFTKPPMVIDDVRNAVIITQILDDNPVQGLDYVNYTMDMPACKGALSCVAKVFETLQVEGIDPKTDDAVERLLAAIPEYQRFLSTSSTEQIIGLYETYVKRLKEDNLIRFADQEPFMFQILSKYPDYLDAYGFKHIIIDEFQDSNSIQLETMRHLMGTKSFESLIVVGDDSQAIYGFRHTSPQNIIHFFDKLGIQGQDIYLTENRRSTPEIIDFANKINDLNANKVEKKMDPIRGSGRKPIVRGFHSKDDEYSYIAGHIENLIKDGCAPEEIAFIAFKKTELMRLGAELSKLGIPWVLKNPMPFTENMKVKAALSLAEAFWQPEAEELYFNYLSAKYEGDIFDKLSIEAIQSEVKEMRDIFLYIDYKEIPFQREIFHDLLEKIKGEDEIYSSFLYMVYANEDLQSELEYIKNFQRFGGKAAKKMEQDYQGVVLTTAHSSKGLEWNHVFASLTGFDSKTAHISTHQEEREELRRLIFVTATRARDELFITGQYVAYGKKDDRTYNQFLRECFEILDEAYNPVDPMEDMKKDARKKRARDRRLANAAPGVREMTAKEKEEYHRLTRNSYQLSLV